MRKIALVFLFALIAGVLVFAISISNNYEPSKKRIEPTKITSTVEYERLFAHDNMRQFKIVMSQEELDGLSNDMTQYYNQYGNLKVGKYRKADVYYTDNYGNTLHESVAIRTKGNTTRVLPESDGYKSPFHFKLKFNETFDLLEGNEEYLERKERKFCDLGELNFKYQFGSDTTYTREIFAYDLFNEVGVLASKASMASVIFVIDGVEFNYGVYTMIEPIDKDFLTKRFGKERNDGNLYKCLWQDYGPASLEPTVKMAMGIKNWRSNYRPAYDLKTNKEKEDHQVLIDFIDNLNKLQGEEFHTYISENFDVDSFLRYLAMTMLIANPDDYWAMGNNYYLYFNNDGKIVFIPTDYDHSFGAGWGGEPVTTYADLMNADIHTYVSIDSGQIGRRVIRKPLVEKILEIEEYQIKYDEYLELYINNDNHYFSYDEFFDTFQTLRNTYLEHVPNYFNQNANMKIVNEVNFFNQKIYSVSEQLDKLSKGEDYE